MKAIYAFCTSRLGSLRSVPLAKAVARPMAAATCVAPIAVTHVVGGQGVWAAGKMAEGPRDKITPRRDTLQKGFRSPATLVIRPCMEIKLGKTCQ